LTATLVAVLVAVWVLFSKFTTLLLPVIVTDCVCVLDAEDALATPLTATAAAGVTTAGLTTTGAGFQTGVQAGIALTVLTSQHCLTTQHATVGQQDVVGHAQLQHVEVVQLVH